MRGWNLLGSWQSSPKRQGNPEEMTQKEPILFISAFVEFLVKMMQIHMNNNVCLILRCNIKQSINSRRIV